MKEKFSFEKVKNTIKFIQNSHPFLKENLIIAGGVVPYLIYQKASTRKHQDIDFICELSSIPKIKEILREQGFYNEKLDSKYIWKKESGFEIIINNIKVGIYPFESKNNSIYQYSYDAIKKECKLKIINVKENEYVKKYGIYKTMAIEVILKSKLMSFREIDKLDIDFICKHPFDNLLYKKILIEKGKIV